MIRTFRKDAVTKGRYSSKHFARGIRQRDEENGAVADLEFNVTVSPTKGPYLHSVPNRITGTYGPSSPETFTLHVVSRDTGKPTIAAVADSLLRNAAHGLHRNSILVDEDTGKFSMPVADLEGILEGTAEDLLCSLCLLGLFTLGDRGYGPPDLMIVHNVTVPRWQSLPLELYSFPPWQVRLTEI